MESPAATGAPQTLPLLFGEGTEEESQKALPAGMIRREMSPSNISSSASLTSKFISIYENFLLYIVGLISLYKLTLTLMLKLQYIQLPK